MDEWNPTIKPIPGMAYRVSEEEIDEYIKSLQMDQEKPQKSANSKQVAGSHYQRDIQPWDIIQCWGLGFWRGNVVKYVLRSPEKSGKEDLEKAKHYLEFLIENYDDLDPKNM